MEPVVTPRAGVLGYITRNAKEWSFRFILLSMSLLVSLVAVELMLAVFFPLYSGRDNVTLDGQPIRGWFPSNSVYRQISNEYDVRTTITEKGHRVPGTDGNPDVIFLGDSFTYGYGLSDEETFAFQYCQSLNVQCANLGMPGSGTARQLARLEKFLADWHWKPREVKLFFFGMSTAFSAGNDFADNYGRRPDQVQDDDDGVAPRTAPAGGITRRIIGAQEFLLEHSNLIRRAKYYWGPMLKTVLVDEFGDERMARALTLTKRSLDEFDALSRRVGFEYRIYLFVPVQDIKRGTHRDTLQTLNRVSPKPAIETAHLFLDAPERYYFAYDGHFNATGARRIAEFLTESDRR